MAPIAVMLETVNVRLASTFHGGLAGAGLLMLRLGLGTVAIFEAVAYLTGHSRPTPLAWGFALSAIVSGVFLVLGFLTPVASLVVCLDALLPELIGTPTAMPNLFGLRLSTVLIVVVTASTILAGPGALSVDARISGLRRIRIPRTMEPPV